MSSIRTLGTLAICLILAGPGLALPTPVPTTDPVQAAFDHLYDAAGVPRVAVDPPDIPGLAGLVEAVADAADVTHRTLAGIEDPDRFWSLLLDHGLPGHEVTVENQEDAAWLHQQLLSLDMSPMEEAAEAIRKASELIVVPEAPTAAANWVDPTGMVVVGDAGGTCAPAHTVERVLIVDLGGDDCYDNFAASATPWSGLLLPVSVIVETAGNDAYTTSAQHPFHPYGATWGQGVGVGGIGLIIDRWGDDRYTTSLGTQTNGCVYFGSAHVQRLYAQGVGVLGVGGILDGSGNDRYHASNVNSGSSGCHWNVAYTFAQAVGLDLGVGVLVDDTGNDQYYAYSEEMGDDPDNNAHTVAQAASSVGVADLLDKEGDDDYYAGAYSAGSQLSAQKGSHAYVFAQGSNLHTDITPSYPDSCLVNPIVAATGLCVPMGCGGLEAGVQASQGCTPGSATLVDLLGADDYTIDVGSDVPACTYTSRSVGMGQGGSAWFGQGSLIDADIGPGNRFLATADATADRCTAEAHLYVQGFAGTMMYDRFDSQWQGVMEHAAVGTLLSLGPVEPDLCPLVTFPPISVLGLGPIHIADMCLKQDRTHIIDSADDYQAHSSADSIGAAIAKTFAQGMGRNANGARTTPVGLHVDLAGHDTRNITANAWGPLPDADVRGQGAGVDGVGSLTDIGGDDVYDAYAFHNGGSVPPRTLVQAYSEGSLAALPSTNACIAPLILPPPLGSIEAQCIANPTQLLGVGVLVDVFGWDQYSEAAERSGCQTNGQTLGTWPLGPVIGTPSGLGPAFWGTVLTSPCQNLPTPTTGDSLSLGADLESDVNVW